MGRQLLILVVLVVSIAGVVKGQNVAQALSEDESAKKAVLKLEHEKLRAAFDGAAALADWHDQHDAGSIVITEANGSTVPKAQRVAEYRSGDLMVLFQDHYDYQVHVYNGNTAVVTCLEYGINERKGKGRRNVHAAATDVFVKTDDGWRTVAHQITSIPAD